MFRKLNNAYAIGQDSTTEVVWRPGTVLTGLTPRHAGTSAPPPPFLIIAPSLQIIASHITQTTRLNRHLILPPGIIRTLRMRCNCTADARGMSLPMVSGRGRAACTHAGSRLTAWGRGPMQQDTRSAMDSQAEWQLRHNISWIVTSLRRWTVEGI